MLIKLTLPLWICSFVFSSTSLYADEQTPLTIEEQRVIQAQQAMPVIKTYFDWSVFKKRWTQEKRFITTQQTLSLLGSQLWQYSKAQVKTAIRVDDRPLYWTRLAVISYIKKHPNNFSQEELTALIETFESASRGRQDLTYSKKTHKRILLTGFDPFLLDRNIKQSNPSGLAALLLDGAVIEYQQEGKSITAEINAAMIPVRYADFNQGEVESLLAPFYALNNVDLIATISMGRSDFDLEHFPGLRRSSTAPDNVNVYTGANKTNPLIPKLLKSSLGDDEFVLFSLPYEVMMKAKGKYKVNDHRGVTILSSGKAKDITANTLMDLTDKISVQGSGGGYLSNEISYRSIILRNQLDSSIPTGHIHTPRILDFNEKTNEDILSQLKAMLIESLTEI